MRLTIKTPGDVSAFGIALSQNRIGWIALAIGAYLSGTLWLFRSHHAGTDVGADDRRTGWYSTGVLNVAWPDLGRESIPLRKAGARGFIRKSGRLSCAISSISGHKIEFDISSHANGVAVKRSRGKTDQLHCVYCAPCQTVWQSIELSLCDFNHWYFAIASA